jgi:cysteinyl-tRNA synthetase
MKEEFIPLEPGKLKLYACGPTVYNYFHIGNARAFIFFDVVRRYFEYLNYDVTYVQNITDIDDKIIEQSKSEGREFRDIAGKYTQAFLEDCAALGIKAPNHQPRATDTMPQIIELIHDLQKKGFAYEVNGDVYFDTASLPEYGSLSGKQVDDQMAGARVAENTAKKHPADFTLWKASKPGEPFWQSPWGNGRPGWHTECVVMSRHYLGTTFDIHGGGIDLVFPHHENENAQAIALSGQPLARYWMHNGFLNVDGEKMSKSLKNFFTARDILQEYDAEDIRHFFLSKHYRSPIDFTRELIEESHKAMQNLHKAMGGHDYYDLLQLMNQDKAILALEQEFKAAMDDDFNTAKAIAILFDLSHIAKKQANDPIICKEASAMLLKLGRVLGFFQKETQAKSESIPDLSGSLIELILSYRAEARTEKNWLRSDKIRDDLQKLGIEIKDSTQGSTWSIKET